MIHERDPAQVLADLRQLRSSDAPTRGGRVLSYVYDSGLAELAALQQAAAVEVLEVNGLDPLTFGSVAALEQQVVGFVRDLLHGGADGSADDVVGSVTSGGSESCLLAVKTARDLNPGRSRVVAPSTVHPAFRKAVHLLGMQLDVVPVDPATGIPAVDDVLSQLSQDVALLVLSAPNYPFGVIDPIEQLAPLAAARGIDVHVDACVGGLALPFWPDPLPQFDFAVAGVTSMAADVHKYGYSPKGVSVLLHRGRDRQRAQYFADLSWPGYPVVTPTTLGSRSITGLAAGWAAISALGRTGLTRLMVDTHRAVRALEQVIAAIGGLRLVGPTQAPLLALAAAGDASERVDPHRLVDALAGFGWLAQSQPSLVQSDGTRLPATAHLTITPVTLAGLDDLGAALVQAAEQVRGLPPVDASGPAAAIVATGLDDRATSEQAGQVLAMLGVGQGPLAELAPLLALVEQLPRATAERLLTELLARVLEPATTPAAPDGAHAAEESR